jgi:plastocyanin
MSAMENENFKMADIQIGDEIIFTNAQKVEHNIFWKVIKKISASQLLVEIKEMGFAEKQDIEISDVVNIQKSEFQFYPEYTDS